jgi:hypothetical protein
MVQCEGCKNAEAYEIVEGRDLCESCAMDAREESEFSQFASDFEL